MWLEVGLRVDIWLEVGHNNMDNSATKNTFLKDIDNNREQLMFVLTMLN